MATKKANETVIEIKPIVRKVAKIRITGDTPLIVHAWALKSKRQMLEKQKGESKGKEREPKNEIEDFVNSMYWLSEKPSEYTEEAVEAAFNEGARFGFHVTAFKAAAISGAYRNGWIKDKVSARGSFFVHGCEEDDMFAEIITPEPPHIREDMVRIGMGTADIRYRGQFDDWYTDLYIEYNEHGQYSLQNIVNMLNAGGFAVGVGEWRAEKGGNFGMYHVEVTEK